MLDLFADPLTRPFTDADYPALPYPGTRPRCSYAHADGTGLPLRPDPTALSGWRLPSENADGHGPTGQDLDDWLAHRGAVPLADRVPLLAYGSNVNPEKLTWLRGAFDLPGPVVVLRAAVRDLAAVWAFGRRLWDTQVPAVLVRHTDAVEGHGVWMVAPDQFGPLDRCEGRGVRYRLARLPVPVTLENGARAEGVWTYVPATDVRAPLLVDGARVRCALEPQANAQRLYDQGEPDPDWHDPTFTDSPGTPVAAQWPDTVFVYGTLRPGESAWSLIAPYVADHDTPPATVAGTLLETGHDYPALRLTGGGSVPGTVLRLRDPVEALPALDRYEGAQYRRVRVTTDDGTVCWTYVWINPESAPDGNGS